MRLTHVAMSSRIGAGVLLPFAFTVASAAAQSPESTYEFGRTMYLAGEIDLAFSSFARLTDAPAPWPTLAAYGMGNCLVQRAIESSLDRKSRGALLLEAVAEYRRALEMPAKGILDPDDARHNLELAKRLLILSETAGDTRPSARTDSRQANESRDSEDRGENVTDGDAPTENGPLDTTASPKDEGDVEKAKGGIPFVDPGRWSAEQAKAKLGETIDRVEKAIAKGLKIQPARRRRATGDY